MELPSSDEIYSLKVDDFDTAQLLTNASRQRDERGLNDVFIVDADSHHYETESVRELLDYIEDPVMKQLSMSALGPWAHLSQDPPGICLQAGFPWRYAACGGYERLGKPCV